MRDGFISVLSLTTHINSSFRDMSAFVVSDKVKEWLRGQCCDLFRLLLTFFSQTDGLFVCFGLSLVLCTADLARHFKLHNSWYDDRHDFVFLQGKWLSVSLKAWLFHPYAAFARFNRCSIWFSTVSQIITLYKHAELKRTSEWDRYGEWARDDVKTADSCV